MVTTNFRDGVTNAAAEETLGDYIRMDPTQSFQFFEDFASVNVGTTGTDWLATNVGSTPTYVAASVDGGAVLITNTGGANDSCFIQWQGKNAGTAIAPCLITAGKRAWFKARFKVSDATLSIVVMGLQNVDTTPAVVSDGVFFIKPTAAATVNFVVEGGSTATTTSAVATMANDTWIDVGWQYNGIDKVIYYINNTAVGTAVITNLPTAALTPSFGIQNGEAVAKTMTVDYIFFASER
jgi:hypothetical protein